ncbi:rCG36873 [Rattus norvegicus]|uniref:RCG36873 n=1 Tax=Rattus norvegicus TaxID=10116 RepID=A6HU70_RAT|nr:rCG36873 [Rattus norvegicus]
MENNESRFLCWRLKEKSNTPQIGLFPSLWKTTSSGFKTTNRLGLHLVWGSVAAWVYF